MQNIIQGLQILNVYAGAGLYAIHERIEVYLEENVSYRDKNTLEEIGWHFEEGIWVYYV